MSERISATEPSCTLFQFWHMTQASRTVECTSTLADDIRYVSWKKAANLRSKKDLVGATVPHPSEMMKLRPRGSHPCPDCLVGQGKLEGDYMLIISDHKQKDNSRHPTPGSFIPYLGSSTAESSASLTPHSLKSDEPQTKKALGLTRSVGWFVAAGSHLHTTILNLLSSYYGDLPDIVLDYVSDRSSCPVHRYLTETVQSGCFAPSAPTPASHYSLSTDHMVHSSNAEENMDFLFQALMIFSQTLCNLHRLKTEENPVSYHNHPSCLECFRPLPEFVLESGPQLCFPPCTEHLPDPHLGQLASVLLPQSHLI